MSIDTDNKERVKTILFKNFKLKYIIYLLVLFIGVKELESKAYPTFNSFNKKAAYESNKIQIDKDICLNQPSSLSNEPHRANSELFQTNRLR